MKKILLLTIVLCFGLQQMAMARPFGELVTKEKKISKRYTVTAADRLFIDNQFGDVQINTWDRNEISVEVNIEVKRRSERRAQDLMDDISINYDNEVRGGKISFKTQVGRSTINNSNGEKLRIDYTVYMPKGNALNIENKFGNVTTGDFEGDMDLQVQYGGLKMENITGSEKKIKVSFGKVNIQSIVVATMKIEYSPVVIDKAQRLGLKNQFGKTTINTVQQLNIIQEYGNLDIGTVNSISGKAEFAGVNIDRLNKSLDMNLNYCSKTNINGVSSAVNLLKIKSTFSNLYFRFDKNINFIADISTSFGSFKNDNEEIRKNLHRTDDNENYERSKTYNGTIGNGSGKMSLSTEYGSLRFE